MLHSNTVYYLPLGSDTQVRDGYMPWPCPMTGFGEGRKWQALTSGGNSTDYYIILLDTGNALAINTAILCSLHWLHSGLWFWPTGQWQSLHLPPIHGQTLCSDVTLHCLAEIDCTVTPKNLWATHLGHSSFLEWTPNFLDVSSAPCACTFFTILI